MSGNSCIAKHITYVHMYIHTHIHTPIHSHIHVYIYSQCLPHIARSKPMLHAQWTKGVPILYVATGATFMKASILTIITSIQLITYKVFHPFATYYSSCASQFSMGVYLVTLKSATYLVHLHFVHSSTAPRAYQQPGAPA